MHKTWLLQAYETHSFLYARCLSLILGLLNTLPSIRKPVVSTLIKMTVRPFFLFLSLLPFCNSQTFLKILPENSSASDETIVGEDPVQAYCESWRLSVETNNAGPWKKITSRCRDALDTYIKGPQYLLDSKVAARHAYSYAKSIKLAGDKKDAWIFDVDETLISNVQHYTAYGYGYCSTALILLLSNDINN